MPLIGGNRQARAPQGEAGLATVKRVTEATTPSAQPLLTPREGTPEPIDTAAGLAEAAQRLAAGTGPVAIDAERASGYRYTGRAYLVQLRRAGSGTLLIDPLPFDDLAPIAEASQALSWKLSAPVFQELRAHPAVAGALLEAKRLELKQDRRWSKK